METETEECLQVEETIIKKIYHISGFDCANCATQVEEHLNSNEEISSARIDFSANKLYISYKVKPWTVEKLIQVIEEIESDSLEIYEEGQSHENHDHYKDPGTSYSS